MASTGSRPPPPAAAAAAAKPGAAGGPPPKPAAAASGGLVVPLVLMGGVVGVVGYYSSFASEGEKANLLHLLRLGPKPSAKDSEAPTPFPGPTGFREERREEQPSPAPARKVSIPAEPVRKEAVSEESQEPEHHASEDQDAEEEETAQSHAGRVVHAEAQHHEEAPSGLEEAHSAHHDHHHAQDHAHDAVHEADHGQQHVEAKHVEAKREESHAQHQGSYSVGKKQHEAAASHFAGYESRARDLRLDTLERAAEEALAENEALKKHLNDKLFKDLATLSPEALKSRVIQLTVELQERTKWEALRLHETVRKAQDEASKKYISLIEKLRDESIEELQRQSRAYEAERELALHRLGEEKEEQARKATEAALKAQAAAIEEAYTEALNKERAEVEVQVKRVVENALYKEHDKYKAATDGRLEELQALSARVEALDRALANSADYEHVSWKVHKQTAAVLALELKLLTPGPVHKELQALRKVTAGDEVIESVLAGLPPKVGSGVPTLSELQVRFPTVRTAAREAAFVPETSPGLVGHMVGSTFAALSIQPKGLVAGSGADEILSRAAYHVERGDLASCVKELTGLEGLPAKRVQDWLSDAKARLLVEQALIAMNARIALQNASLI